MIPLMKNAFLNEYETKMALADFINMSDRLSMDVNWMPVISSPDHGSGFDLRHILHFLFEELIRFPQAFCQRCFMFPAHAMQPAAVH